MAKETINTEKYADNTNQNGVVEDKDSYRCNACCTEFQIIEELIEHVSQNHVNSDGAVVCGDCQLEYRGVDEFLEHYRQCHDENIGKNQDGEFVKIAVEIGQISPDDTNPITILNDEGETVGLTANAEHQTDIETNGNDSPSSNLRKRRPSSKLRDSLYEPSSKRLSKVLRTQPASVMTMARSSEVEIDVSDVNVVRLKTTRQDRQEEIFHYLQRVDEKLDSIIKHFNVPYSGGSILNHPSTKPVRKSSLNKNLDAALAAGITNLDSRPSVVRQGDLHFIEAESTQQEITQYVISDDLLEATYLKSRNRGNFAKNLVFAAFPVEERLGRNCFGRRGGSLSGPKGALEAAKLDAVREAVFRKYPLELHEDEEYIWKRECVIAVDTALRSEMRSRIMRMQKE